MSDEILKRIFKDIAELQRKINILEEENAKITLQNKELLEALTNYKMCATQNGCKIK